jgi:alanyl-tRNA synthetase
MSDAFPELRSAHHGRNVEHVTFLIREEEELFVKTLDRGIDWWWTVATQAMVSRALQLNEQRSATDKIRITSGYSKPNSMNISFDLTSIVSKPGKRGGAYMTAKQPLAITVGQSEVFRGLLRDIRAVDLDKAGILGASISGPDAFELKDTYGFPIDLTQLMAEERGLTVNIGEYERLMVEARERARANRPAQMSIYVESHGTDDSKKYDTLELEALTQAIGVSLPAAPLDNSYPSFSAFSGTRIEIHLDKTCFYSEQGGQVGDTGTIEAKDWTAEIQDTQKGGVSVAHIGVIKAGVYRWEPNSNKQELVRLKVNGTRRKDIMKNHTATHVMNWALREVLGDHVEQKGSLVDPDKTRFDFSHPSHVTEEEFSRIEELVNSQIEEDLEIFTAEADQKKGPEINTSARSSGRSTPTGCGSCRSARAGRAALDDPKNDEWMRYSVEFAAGRTSKRTSEIRRFRLIGRIGGGQGIRASSASPPTGQPPPTNGSRIGGSFDDCREEQ